MRSPFSMILTFALTSALSLPGMVQSAGDGQYDAPQESTCINVAVAVNVVVEVNVSVNVTVNTDDAEGGITLAWQTGIEPDTAGFNVYRLDDAWGSYAKINDALIPPQGNPGSGGSYTSVDRPGSYYGTSYYYMLESMGIDGKRKPRAIVSVSTP